MFQIKIYKLLSLMRTLSENSEIIGPLTWRDGEIDYANFHTEDRFLHFPPRKIRVVSDTTDSSKVIIWINYIPNILNAELIDEDYESFTEENQSYLILKYGKGILDSSITTEGLLSYLNFDDIISSLEPNLKRIQ